MVTNTVTRKLLKASGKAQLVVKQACEELDETGITFCELLEMLNIEHSFCDGIYSFNLNEVTTGDKVEMTYDLNHLSVCYFRDNKLLGEPQTYYCDTTGTALCEILYAINYQKSLHASLAYLLFVAC